MSRYLGPKCRLCRQEGVKLFLRGERCSSPKCPIERKGAVPPGQHGVRKYSSRRSDYGKQLREKQKIRKMYGILERQLKKYFEKARKEKEATGKALLRLLETRLDNVVFRLGFTSSRGSARQLIKHGHILVDNKKVDISSFLTKEGNVISFKPGALEILEVKKMLGQKDFQPPGWLERKAGVGRVAHLPKDEDLPQEIDEQLIVEFYSRA